MKPDETEVTRENTGGDLVDDLVGGSASDPEEDEIDNYLDNLELDDDEEDRDLDFNVDNLEEEGWGEAIVVMICDYS